MKGEWTKGRLVAHHQPYDCQSGDGTNDSIMTEDGDVIALIVLVKGTRADVQLWAAAPALAEALESMVALYDTDEGASDIPEIIAARAALTVARERQ